MARDRQPIILPTPGEVISIWHHLTLAEYEEFQRTGVLKVTDDQIEELTDPEFGEQYAIPYQWLRRQMTQRVPGYKGGIPVEATYWPNPDLRYRGYFETGTKAVLLHCRVSSERVLLMDNDVWVGALNLWHLTLTEKESKKFDKKAKAVSWHDRIKHFREEIEKSWEVGFDINAVNQSDYIGPCALVLAWIENLNTDDVVRVQPYTARRHKMFSTKKP